MAQPRLNGVSPNSIARCKAYFSSGWTFLLPYTLVYSVYAFAGWPINSSDADSNIPPLLHVYWIIHFVHFVLGFLTLVYSVASILRSRPAQQEKLYHLSPWLFLVAFAWLPGAYLEFPADNWEHLSRIAQWSAANEVIQHWHWKKSGYFLFYSVFGLFPRLAWFTVADALSSALSVLLSWNYYRLAREAGVSQRRALVFVILQVICFGNSIFAFSRYYGLSSTILAQIAAVAAIRIGLKLASDLPCPSSTASTRSAVRHGLALTAAAFIIAFNHVQGLGIALLGLGAIAVWRMLLCSRARGRYLALMTIVTCIVTVLFLPRHDYIDDIYRRDGWLSQIYGFNLLLPGTPAFDRGLAILGAGGLASVAAALFLLRHNHVVAWLTLTPIIALALPVVALPVANALAGRRNWVDDIVTFHRLLLAIPTGLSLVVAGSQLASLARARFVNAENSSWSRGNATRSRPFYSLLWRLGLAGTIVLLLPVGSPGYGRLWHLIAVTPADLALKRVAARAIAHQDDRRVLLSTSGVSFVTQAVGGKVAPLASRLPVVPSDATAVSHLNRLVFERLPKRDFGELEAVVTYSFSPRVFTSPVSQAGLLSGHWLPQRACLANAGTKELEQAWESIRTSQDRPDPILPVIQFEP